MQQQVFSQDFASLSNTFCNFILKMYKFAKYPHFGSWPTNSKVFPTNSKVFSSGNLVLTVQVLSDAKIKVHN